MNAGILALFAGDLNVTWEEKAQGEPELPLMVFFIFVVMSYFCFCRQLRQSRNPNPSRVTKTNGLLWKLSYSLCAILAPDRSVTQVTLVVLIPVRRPACGGNPILQKNQFAWLHTSCCYCL